MSGSARPCPGPARTHGDPGPITGEPLCEDCRRYLAYVLVELPGMMGTLHGLAWREDTGGYAPARGLTERVQAAGDPHSPLDLGADELVTRITGLVSCWTEIIRDRAKLHSGGWLMLQVYTDTWVSLPAQTVSVWGEDGWGWEERTGAQAAVELMELHRSAAGRVGIAYPFRRLSGPCEGCGRRTLVVRSARGRGEPDDMIMCQHCHRVCTRAAYETYQAALAAEREKESKDA